MANVKKPQNKKTKPKVKAKVDKVNKVLKEATTVLKPKKKVEEVKKASKAALKKVVDNNKVKTKIQDKKPVKKIMPKTSSTTNNKMKKEIEDKRHSVLAGIKLWASESITSEED